MSSWVLGKTFYTSPHQIRNCCETNNSKKETTLDRVYSLTHVGRSISWVPFLAHNMCDKKSLALAVPSSDAGHAVRLRMVTVPRYPMATHGGNEDDWLLKFLFTPLICLVILKFWPLRLIQSWYHISHTPGNPLCLKKCHTNEQGSSLPLSFTPLRSLFQWWGSSRSLARLTGLRAILASHAGRNHIASR